MPSVTWPVVLAVVVASHLLVVAFHSRPLPYLVQLGRMSVVAVVTVGFDLVPVLTTTKVIPTL